MQRRALLSVTDKSGIVDLSAGLIDRGFHLISTGGTARALRDAGLSVTEVEELTGFPEILGGRVKTLHPRLLGGVLARPYLDSDRKDAAAHDIQPFDLVVVNLYRFEEALEKFEQGEPSPGALSDASIAAVIEQIDIGGPTMVRAAAKNSRCVSVVVDPGDYSRVLAALDQGGPDEELRAVLAAKAFRRVAEYDLAVDRFFSCYLAGKEATLPPAARLALADGCLGRSERVRMESERPWSDSELLRYGENPHQRGFLIRSRRPTEAAVVHSRLLSGKKLSYNNLLDAEAALELVKEFDAPAAVVIKHTNPCGAAVAETPVEAFDKAYLGDPLSAFGGIVAFNRPVAEDLARKIAIREHFFEVLVAPSVSEAALKILIEGAPWGKNLRVLACGETRRAGNFLPPLQLRSVVGGWLVQERDFPPALEARSVTARAPTPAEESDLEIAWKIVKHVRSNAIVLVKDGMLVGTGAGQMSRVKSVDIALQQAAERAPGAVLASDAFFPFRDGVDTAARAGVKAMVQPGGSRRDPEVIAACDEHDVAMWFTGQRHFKH